MTLNDKEKKDLKANLIAASTGVSVLLLVTIAFFAWSLYTFPSSKEYIRYEMNKPVIDSFEGCVKLHKKGCLIVPIDSLGAMYYKYNLSSVNWSGTINETVNR